MINEKGIFQLCEELIKKGSELEQLEIERKQYIKKLDAWFASLKKNVDMLALETDPLINNDPMKEISKNEQL